MDFVKKSKAKINKKMKFLTNFIKEHRTLALTVFVGVLLVASGIYMAITRTQAIAPTWAWANKIGDVGIDHGKAVATDDAGNIYVAGEFVNTNNFAALGCPATALPAPNPGKSTLYIAKFDSSGATCIWGLPLTGAGSNGDAFVNDIAVNSSGTSGEIYINGSFITGLTLGSFALTGPGYESGFIARLDFTDPSTFTWIWADSLQSFGPTAGSALDIEGTNAYFTGYFTGSSVQLHEAYSSLDTIFSGHPSNKEIFVSKLDSSTGAVGGGHWFKTAGSTSNDQGLGIDVDSSGNSYVSGSFTGPATFDPDGTPVIVNSQALGDAFISKYDSTGALVWVNPVGGDDGAFIDQASDVKIGSDGNINVTGLFKGDAMSTFPPVFTAISGGRIHSLGLKSDGTAWAWGNNSSGPGQLGNGNNTNSNVPVQVCAPAGYDDCVFDGLIAIAASGITDFSMALKDDNTVWDWGGGMLGDGSTTDSNLPIHVCAPSGCVDGLLSGIDAISGGGPGALALKNDGTIWAWGSNFFGELGRGTNDSGSNLPVHVCAPSGCVDGSLSGVIAIAGGAEYSLALKSDGTVWAWGDNSFGQLGNGNNTSTNLPVQVCAVGGCGGGFLTGVTAIAAGSHSMALKSDGTVVAWGGNSLGQLGNGNNTDSNVPVQVCAAAGCGGGFLTGVTAIAATGQSLALKSDGTVWSWGINSSGQLGNGNTTSTNLPVQVCAPGQTDPCSSFLTDVTSISAGQEHSIALKSDGTAWDWGQNVSGQLGNGNNIDSLVPVEVGLFNSNNLDLIGSNTDIFVTKFNSDGNFVWTPRSRKADTSSIFSPSITLDDSDGVFVAGDFSGSAAIDGGDTPTSAGSDDVLVFGYDIDGNYLWSKQAGGTASDYASDLVFDAVNGVWNVTGSYASDPASFGSIDLAQSGIIVLSPFKNIFATLGLINIAEAIAPTFYDGFIAQIAPTPVITPPLFSKAFSPDTITQGGTSTLIFTINNISGSGNPATSLSFSDTLPANVLVATPSVTSTTCGGVVIATTGSGNISFSGGLVPQGDTCTVSVDVTSSIPGSYLNTSGPLTSSEGSSGTASDTLTVNPPGGGAPIITTQPATSIGQHTATINGTWDANGASTTTHFDWNLLVPPNTCSTQSLGNSTTPVSQGLGSGSMSGTLTGLLFNKTYCFRAVGTNINGTTNATNNVSTYVVNGIGSFTTLSSGFIGGSSTNGACGLANGGLFQVAPLSYLCLRGTPNPAIPTDSNGSAPGGTWNWTCEGSGANHTDASCSANVQLTVAACGSANGGTFQTRPSANLCAPNGGTASAVNGPAGGHWNWLCYIPQSQPLIQKQCSAIGPLPPPVLQCAGWATTGNGCCNLTLFPQNKNKIECVIPPTPKDGDELLPPNPVYPPGDLQPPNPLFPGGGTSGGGTPAGGGTTGGGTTSGGGTSTSGSGGASTSGGSSSGQGTPSGFVNGILNSILPAGLATQITNALNGQSGIVANIISTFGLVLGAISVAISALSVSSIIFSDLPLLPFKLWSALMAFLGVRKEQKWGYVISSATQEGIDPAYVVLFDAAGNEVATGITDLEGRYGFPVTKPGTYTLVANKGGYDAFPSKKLAGQTSTSLYKDLYFGGPIEIKEEGQIITKNIPLDPLNFDWNQIQKNKLGRYTSRTGRAKLIAKISNFFFAIGFVVATLSLIFAPKYYNVAIFALYVVLFFLRRYSVLKAKKKGKIMKGGLPLPFAVLRVFQASVPDVEVAHSVANQDGSFYRLIPNGKYIVKIDEMVSEGAYKPAFTSTPFEVKTGIINTQFAIQ